MTEGARVISVARDGQHRFAKEVQPDIRLIEGLGVEGDAHCGTEVKHRSRAKKTPDAPNLRQVHLIHCELFDELAQKGFVVGPGMLGENVTTAGIDLLALPRGTLLRLGQQAIVELTGLRNPCFQIDNNIGRGAMAATLERTSDGGLVRKAGVMAVVAASGVVAARDAIEVVYPAEALPLEPV